MEIGHIYLIHLERRTDRKDGYFKVDKNGEFILDDNGEKIWIKGFVEKLEGVFSEYEVFPAIDGMELDVQLPPQTGQNRWNKGAYALTLTTIKILEDAMEKGYENILILEDDVVINPLFDIVIDNYLSDMTFKFDFAFLGYTTFGNCAKPETRYWDRIVQMCSCHAYIVNKHLFPTYKNILSQLNVPIDVHVNSIVAARLNSFSAVKWSGHKLIWQEDGISDIEAEGGKFYAVGFTD